MPPRLFKYLRSKHVPSFIGRGEILFRSLSYFRNYEELQVRGDRFEGRRLYKPDHGLEITNTTTGQKSVFPGAMESKVQDRKIFVFCMSTALSPDLAREFNSDVCVEILNPSALIARVRSSIRLLGWVRRGRLLHGGIEYYSPTEAPIAEWAVPERMVMRKTLDYSSQSEYRMAFARGNALEVNNVEVLLSTVPGSDIPTLEGHPELTIKVGNLERICTIHHFT